MSKKHYSPKTGKVENCKAKNGCPLGSDIPHGDNAEEVMRQGQEYERKRAEKDGYTETGAMSRNHIEKQEMLSKGVTAYQSGFAAANKYFSSNLESQIEFTKTDAVRRHLTKEHCSNPNETTLKNLAYAIHAHGDDNVGKFLGDKISKKISDEDKRKILNKEFHGAEEMDDYAFARAGNDLVNGINKPFYSDLKKAIRTHNESTPFEGYTPSDKKGIDKTGTLSIAEKMKVTNDQIPEGVAAFDVETDTSNGEGLNPHKAQITEIVISTKDETVILYGDEKHILQEFRKHMDSMPDDTTIVGWNNRGFDNIFVSERAKSHNIKGWPGTLVDCDIDSKYAPADGYERPQEMRWRKPNGNVLKDEDGSMMAHQKYKRENLNKSTAMKPFVKEYGVQPIEVNRAEMHKLTEQERKDYVGSDGIATLFAYKLLKDEELKNRQNW